MRPHYHNNILNIIVFACRALFNGPQTVRRDGGKKNCRYTTTPRRKVGEKKTMDVFSNGTHAFVLLYFVIKTIGGGGGGGDEVGLNKCVRERGGGTSVDSKFPFV